jgi:hypothetical protein
MASDARKRQKKLERRSARRKEKRRAITRRQPTGLAERLAVAAECPVLDCWVSDSLESEGIGQVGLSRLLPNGLVAVASFLVDRYCLGVKDVHAEVLPRSEYEDIYRHELATRLPSHSLTPADARALVEAAVEYARGIGLPPHPDYARAKLLFGSITPTGGALVEFGKDGKPFFVSGPNDSLLRCKRIVDTLTRTCGPGNFDYLIGVGPPPASEEDLDLDDLAVPDEWRDEGDE